MLLNILVIFSTKPHNTDMATLKNNFLSYKAEFKSDTGLDFSPANMPLYIQYVAARSADYAFQTAAFLYQDPAMKHTLEIILGNLQEIKKNTTPPGKRGY